MTVSESKDIVSDCLLEEGNEMHEKAKDKNEKKLFQLLAELVETERKYVADLGQVGK